MDLLQQNQRFVVFRKEMERLLRKASYEEFVNFHQLTSIPFVFEDLWRIIPKKKKYRDKVQKGQFILDYLISKDAYTNQPPHLHSPDENMFGIVKQALPRLLVPINAHILRKIDLGIPAEEYAPIEDMIVLSDDE
jgi:hypothetical protein